MYGRNQPSAQAGFADQLPYRPDSAAQQQPQAQIQQSPWATSYAQQVGAIGQYSGNGTASGSSRNPRTDYLQQSYDQEGQDLNVYGTNGTSDSGMRSSIPSQVDTPETNDQKNGGGDGGPAKKRKKKVGDVETDPDDKDKDKRIKTGRACDACRSKKIRCDILPSDSSPSGGEAQQICARCKQYNLDCTFFLPITETRFKRRRPTDDRADGKALSGNEHIPVIDPSTPREVPTRTEGPTSLSFLLHTTLPASAAEAYDLREHNRWEVSDEGNGFLRVTAPPVNGQEESDDPTRSYKNLVRPHLNAEMITDLVNAYFEQIAPLFPVVQKSRLTKNPPSPFLLYSMCGLGATLRRFPREIFTGVRGVINGMLRSNDILSDARFENVQALLLLGQVGDLHAQPTASTASASLVRLASAIRMAQDLGLHRETSAKAQTAEDVSLLECKRRVWATCVIMDRWYGAALGIPLLIDLLDCDVLLPGPYKIIPEADPSTWPIEPNYAYLGEHLKLSILIGRVLKTIYSPTGLKYTTDEQLDTLYADMDAWTEALPEELRFKGVESSWASGMLHMSHAALQFLFSRVFMRIQYTCPPHIGFRLRVDKWNKMLQGSTDAIEWLSANDEAIGTVFIYSYTAVSCALVQYHTWARRRDQSALKMLKVVKDMATKWQATVKPDQMSIRQKTCETMTLLYEAALKTNPEIEVPKDRPPPINLVAGVSQRPNPGRAVWVPDPSKSNGGTWIAKTEDARQNCGIDAPSVVILDELDPQTEEHKRASAMFEQLARELGGEEPGAGGVENALGQQNGNAGTTAQTNQDGTAEVNSGITAETDEFSAMFGMDPVLDIINASTSNPLELNLLDTLPMSGFDFPSWEQYFSSINSTTPLEGDAYNRM